MRHLLLKPIVNEKSMALTKLNFYTFAVASSATKEQIMKLITAKFSVEPVSIKTVSLKVKRRTQKSRKGYFTKSGMKKAIVQLKKGQKLALFEQAIATPEPKAESSASAAAENKSEAKEQKNLLRGTKVRIEKVANKESQDRKADHKRPTKTSQKEAKKGK